MFRMRMRVRMRVRMRWRTCRRIVLCVPRTYSALCKPGLNRVSLGSLGSSDKSRNEPSINLREMTVCRGPDSRSYLLVHCPTSWILELARLTFSGLSVGSRARGGTGICRVPPPAGGVQGELVIRIQQMLDLL